MRVVVRVVMGAPSNSVVVVSVRTVRIVLAHFGRKGVRVVERGRVVKRVIKRVVGEEVGFSNYRSVFFDVGSSLVNGSGLFVFGVYDCCAFDCNFADDNGIGSVMMLLGA